MAFTSRHRVAIITGGAQGIGRGIAKFLLGHTAGYAKVGSYAKHGSSSAPEWSVVVVDHDEAGLNEAKAVFKDYVSQLSSSATPREDETEISDECDPPRIDLESTLEGKMAHEAPHTYTHRHRVAFVKGDCSREETAKEAVQTALTRFGRIDLLVNNAGGGLFKTPLRGQTLEEFYDILHRNVGTAYIFSKAVGIHWETQLEKHRAADPHESHSQSEYYSSAGTFGTNLHNAIVNISSTRALQSEHFSESYAAGKGGVVALTHALASSLAHVARVNGINLGWIDVSGAEYGPGREEYSKTREDISQHWSNKVGEADDVAHAVIFLYENYFMNGQCITLDGGVTKRMSYVE